MQKSVNKMMKLNKIADLNKNGIADLDKNGIADLDKNGIADLDKDGEKQNAGLVSYCGTTLAAKTD